MIQEIYKKDPFYTPFTSSNLDQIESERKLLQLNESCSVA